MDEPWKIFWRVVGGATALSLAVIACLFWSAWRASPFEASANGAPVESGIDVIAIQLDILSLIVALVGIALAVVGIFGFQAIKAGAEAKAMAKADEVATAAVAAYMQKLDGGNTGTQPPIEPPKVTELTEEEKGV